MLGLGYSGGTDVQVIEVAWVEGLDKIGLKLERLERFKDFYRTAFFDFSDPKPWVDLGLHAQLSRQMGPLLFDFRIGGLSAFNYQWRRNLQIWEKNNRWDWMGQVQVFYAIQK